MCANKKGKKWLTSECNEDESDNRMWNGLVNLMGVVDFGVDLL